MKTHIFDKQLIFNEFVTVAQQTKGNHFSTNCTRETGLCI